MWIHVVTARARRILSYHLAVHEGDVVTVRLVRGVARLELGREGKAHLDAAKRKLAINQIRPVVHQQQHVAGPVRLRAMSSLQLLSPIAWNVRLHRSRAGLHAGVGSGLRVLRTFHIREYDGFHGCRKILEQV